VVFGMGFAKARFRVVGAKSSVSGVAIVDTGSIMSVVDLNIAKAIGLKPTGRVVELATLSGDEVLCDEMLTEVFEIEGKALAIERVAVCKLPSKAREKLRALGAGPNMVIGMVTLEGAGLVINPAMGKLEKVDWLAL